ncbi:uncharacterized protein LOC132733515 isoform X2 [Ruditapes philippinarum]|uniref:uncharacterized protein LOC132733515 isoform X2 n=1 Tax=Ruditapes philippinarum TaxID=129788 RepID=UPI00295AA2CA|nr:uncharacterized protein LOC132733515 isoform X2 [Ruditapes philippinarum]
MQWSEDCYRLDKVTDIFGMPCVVRLEEGYLPPDEAEEFAQGDIITLDTEIPSDKVGAYFIQSDDKDKENVKKTPKTPDYGVLTSDSQEVFLPYSYDGKLRVLKKIVKVQNVKELAEIFPGYAELEGKLSIKTNKGESITLTKGTTIELDRTIPGSNSAPDTLVIKFEHSKQEKVAAVPYTMKGKFHTKADLKKYTIKEAIERYGLPLEVKFITDEIRQKFYQEVLAGRRKLASVTATLRLNRIVKQRVIVGHYKPITDLEKTEEAGDIGAEKNENADSENTGTENTEGSEAGNKDVRKRTVVVIPVDDPEIGEIPVNVCEGDVLTIYESLVNIKSVTEARDMVAQTLCLDFEVKPGMKLITANEEDSKKYENVKHGPPPLPARPPRQLPIATDLDGYVDMKGPLGNKVYTENPALPPRKPTPIQLPTKKHDTDKKDKGKKERKHFWQKSVKYHGQEKPKVAEKKLKPAMPDPPSQYSIEDDGLDGYEEIQKTARGPIPPDIDKRPPPSLPVSSSADLGEYEEIEGLTRDPSRTEVPRNNSSGDKTLSGYDEIEEVEALHKQARGDTKPLFVRGTSLTKDSDEATDVHGTSTSHSDASTPENLESNANVSKERNNKAKNTNHKLFQDLSSEELVERLILCNLHDTAAICKEEKLDGSFFTDETPESLKDAFGLQGLKLAKFLKMRDENWVTK